MNSDHQKKVSVVLQTFSSDIAQLLKLVDNKLAGNLEVDRLKRIIRIARDEEPLLIINKCKDKIWDSREKILAEDEDFFVAKKFDEYIKNCLLYTSPSPRDRTRSRMPSSA